MIFLASDVKSLLDYSMEEDTKYWVCLNLVFAEYLKEIKSIVENFPTVKDIFKARQSQIIALGVDKERAKTLLSSRMLDKACREIEQLSKKNYNILTIEDDNYPEHLREIFDPPIVLYYAGDVKLFKSPAVAIVGARKTTPYGRAVAEKLSADLAECGLTVISGMARGIDSLAHWGALKGGKTLAVLGSGLGNIYPRENKKLFEKIIETGVVVTEYSLKTDPLGYHFPLRNRIISGLAIALVVIEAAKKSGSLISARLALEQNREVMAVPGNITSELSWGTNWLIKTGAKPVTDWEDVIEGLPLYVKEKILVHKPEKTEKGLHLNGQEKKIYDLLKSDSMIHIDEIVERSGLSVSEVLSHLLKLELNGMIAQSPGKYFQRKL